MSLLQVLSSEPRLRASATVLIIINVIPLFGAVFLGWDVFTIMMLFWVENLIIGFYAVLRILTAAQAPLPASTAVKLFAVPFFIVHYGMFAMGHGIFVVALFGGGMFRSSGHGLIESSPLFHLPSMPVLFVPAAGMILSHGFSFYNNYLRGGEYKTTNPIVAMFRPYGRVVVLHLAVMAGAFTVTLLGVNWVAVALLVVLKTGLDLAAHLWEHNPARHQTPTQAVPGSQRYAWERFGLVLQQLNTRGNDPDQAISRPEDKQ